MERVCAFGCPFLYNKERVGVGSYPYCFVHRERVVASTEGSLCLEEEVRAGIQKAKIQVLSERSENSESMRQRINVLEDEAERVFETGMEGLHTLDKQITYYNIIEKNLGRVFEKGKLPEHIRKRIEESLKTI